MTPENTPPLPARHKVLIIVENLPVPFDRRVWMEATTLKAAGYEVSIICPTNKNYTAFYEVIDDIHIYRYNLPPEVSSVSGYLQEYSSALWSSWRLALKVRRERGFDVIQLCNPPDLLFMVALPFKLLLGKRVIFDHHDLNPELYESKFAKRGIFYQLLRVMEWFTFRAANTVISTNESYKEVALTRGGKNPEKVYVVRSAPKIDLFKRVPANPVYHHGRKYLVGYLGVMGEFDGIDHLVRAAHELIVKRGRTDIQFCLVGGGPMLDSLKQLAVELGIQDYLEFTGRVPDAELIERISSCDVCAGPDPMNPLNEKSTMNKIVEYMALERPIVQYDLLEGRRSAGEASLYAIPNDVADFATKIETLLSDPESRRRMGDLGRKRIEEEFAWDYQQTRLLQAYAKTLS